MGRGRLDSDTGSSMRQCLTTPADPPVADVQAQIMAMLYPILQIAMVVHGGAGKHTWDVTYAEYYIFNKVRNSPYRSIAHR
jgi:hypothetical protein